MFQPIPEKNSILKCLYVNIEEEDWIQLKESLSIASPGKRFVLRWNCSLDILGSFEVVVLTFLVFSVKKMLPQSLGCSPCPMAQIFHLTGSIMILFSEVGFGGRHRAREQKSCCKFLRQYYFCSEISLSHFKLNVCLILFLSMKLRRCGKP